LFFFQKKILYISRITKVQEPANQK